MEKTININLGGSLFQIEEKAFVILRDYLQAINYRFKNVKGRLETIEDIELRIAELFNSRRSLAGIISVENVESMITILGKPEDFDIEQEMEVPEQTTNRRRLYRNPDDSIISGVCGGIGAYLNIDPVLFRILFVLFTIFFGVGFLVYIALWIALPSAVTDTQRREMYGDHYSTEIARGGKSFKKGDPGYDSQYNRSYGVSNSINELFRATGKIFYLVIRIFLIVAGTLFVLTGSIFLLSFVMIFVVKFPWFFSTDAIGVDLIYLPDFLNYIVNPAVVPWIIVLTLIVLILPMVALIYWGVKMIFWFRAKDSLISLAGLVIWTMSVAALALILFNEGISFAETSKSLSQNIFAHPPDTLYIKTGKSVADLKFQKEISVTDEDYTFFINEEIKELYIRPSFKLIITEDGTAKTEVRKRSSGKNRNEAINKTEELIYNYSIHGDTLMLDEYFTLPAGRKWSADFVGIDLFLPEGTILRFDSSSEDLLRHFSFRNKEDPDLTKGRSGVRTWILTEEGIKPAG